MSKIHFPKCSIYLSPSIHVKKVFITKALTKMPYENIMVKSIFSLF